MKISVEHAPLEENEVILRCSNLDQDVYKRQVVRQGTLTPSFAGSSPAIPAKSDGDISLWRLLMDLCRSQYFKKEYILSLIHI